MAASSSPFVWYELATPDVAGAAAFYRKVVGWEAVAGPVPGMEYRIFTAGEAGVGGLMPLPELQPAAAWVGYVGVESVDRTAEAAVRGGGTICVPPADIPQVGRFAVIADPQGAQICLFTPLTPAPSAAAPAKPVGWHELHAADWKQAFGFYEGLFGWRKVRTFDMGEMGIYQIIAAGEAENGAMFDKPAQEPRPYWLYYITVPDIDRAAKAIAEAGGTILMGPHEVPGGDWIVQARDPQGAVFALVGPHAA